MLKMRKRFLVVVPCLVALLLSGCGDSAPPAEGQGPSERIMQSNGPNPPEPQLGGSGTGTSGPGAGNQPASGR